MALSNYQMASFQSQNDEAIEIDVINIIIFKINKSNGYLFPLKRRSNFKIPLLNLNEWN